MPVEVCKVVEKDPDPAGTTPRTTPRPSGIKTPAKRRQSDESGGRGRPIIVESEDEQPGRDGMAGNRVSVMPHSFESARSNKLII